MFSAIALGVALSACAGRDPQPIATVQPQDATSDCAMINAEIQANNKRAETLASEHDAKIAQNVVAGVVGVVVWPVLFAMDAKGAAATDAAALQARQEYLANLAAIRCVPPPVAAAPPAALPPHRTAAVRPKPQQQGPPPQVPTPSPQPPPTLRPAQN
jgi:hypothetical protein